MSTSPSTMPSLAPLGPASTTDEIDAAIHGLIDLHFEGGISETETRREITGALYASGIHVDVAKTRTDLSPQGRSDLAEMLLALVTKQIMVESDKASAFDLKMAQRSSVCGAIRQFLKTAVPSEMRNMRRSDNRNGTPLDPNGHEFSVIGQTANSLIVWDAGSAHVDGEVGDLVEKYTSMTKGMRETDRMVVNADAICMALGVNPAIRPEWMDDRDYVLAAITEDPTLAARSLGAWFHLVIGSEHAATRPDIDDRVLALWDDQTEDSAREILNKSDHVAHTIALAAVSPLPRPAKKALQRLKTAVSTAAAPAVRDKVWREIASALVDSYVAAEFEAVSQYATMSVDAKQAATTGHTISRSRFETLLVRASNHRGAPLGATAAQVLTQISGIAESVFADEPSKHSIRAAA